MSTEGRQKRKFGRTKRRIRAFQCVVCSGRAPFCWTCPCGFMICPECMQENIWGMTCNNITWVCPDCGAYRGFGND